jgi:glutathione S-transferase
MREPSEPRRVLYRCGTPTNFLCPCGAVARRLKKRGMEYRTERVRRWRSGRPEIVELTGLPYVPVLVDGDEVVSDSRRILQYLDWRYGDETSAEAGKLQGSSEGASTMGADE